MAEENSVVHVAQVPTRWSDFDRYGHLTNHMYVELAQEARQLMAIDEFVNAGVAIPDVFVRQLEIEYLHPILPNTDGVIVESSVTHVGKTSFTTRQEIRDTDGHLCAVISVVQVAVDLETSSPRAITSKEMKILTRGPEGAAE